MKIKFVAGEDVVKTTDYLDVNNYLDNLLTTKEDVDYPTTEYSVHFSMGSFSTDNLEIMKDYLQFTFNLFDFKYECEEFAIFFDEEPLNLEFNDNYLIL